MFDPDSKQLAILRLPNGNIMVGQNSESILVLNQNMEEVKKIRVESDVISIEIVEDEVFCGLANKTICIIGIEHLEVRAIIVMREVV